MRQKPKRQEMAHDLVLAIGLVWGHLKARQFEEAYLLGKGCLRVWPNDRSLILMVSYAAAEVLEPVDMEKLESIKDASCTEWIRLVKRRALIQVNPPAASPMPAAPPPMPAAPPPVRSKSATANAAVNTAVNAPVKTIAKAAR